MIPSSGTNQISSTQVGQRRPPPAELFSRRIPTNQTGIFLVCFVCYVSSDRFMDDQGQRVTPSCFLPFGAGPRVCVGESLARLELFLFLSSLLQRMSFRLPGGAPLPSLQGRLGVVLQPLPFSLVVLPRESTEKAE